MYSYNKHKKVQNKIKTNKLVGLIMLCCNHYFQSTSFLCVDSSSDIQGCCDGDDSIDDDSQVDDSPFVGVDCLSDIHGCCDDDDSSDDDSSDDISSEATGDVISED